MTAGSRHLNLRLPLHADAGFLAQLGENLVLDLGKTRRRAPDRASGGTAAIYASG
jgi:hypothetical protein